MVDKKLVLLASILNISALAMHQGTDENPPKEVYNSEMSPQKVTSYQYLEALRNENICANIILDIGCGTGGITAHIANQFHWSVVDGIDESAELIEIAKKNHSWPNATDSYRNLRFRVGTAVRLFKTEDTINIITSFGNTNWEKNRGQAMENIARALARKGILLLTAGGDINIEEHPLIPVLLRI